MVRVGALRVRCPKLVHALVELRTRVGPSTRHRRGVALATWRSGRQQLTVERTYQHGREVERWWYVSPRVLEQLRYRVPPAAGLVTEVAARWPSRAPEPEVDA